MNGAFSHQQIWMYELFAINIQLKNHEWTWEISVLKIAHTHTHTHTHTNTHTHTHTHERNEGNVLFNDALNTFYLRLYGIRHMVMTSHIMREETRCRHMGYSFRLTAKVLLYVPSHRHDNTYHVLCYTSRGALAGTRNSSMGQSHEGSIRRPIAPWANALTTELHLAPHTHTHTHTNTHKKKQTTKTTTNNNNNKKTHTNQQHKKPQTTARVQDLFYPVII